MILSISAQTASKYFYYYKGKKYFLQLDKSSIAISSTNTDVARNFKTTTPIVENFTKILFE
jgi:hypothetical protein